MDLQTAKMYAEEPGPPGSFTFLQAVNELLSSHGLQFPATIEDAVYMYNDLVSLFEALM